MKRLIFIFFILIMAKSLAFCEGIEFKRGSFRQMLSLAIQEQRLIFVDAYTTWCGPCRHMSQHVFTDPIVGALFNEHFINYKLDMETGEGFSFNGLYFIEAYPTLLILNENGEVISRQEGSLDVEGLILFALQALGKKSSEAVELGWEEEWVKEENWEFVHELLTHVDHPAFQLIEEAKKWVETSISYGRLQQYYSNWKWMSKPG